MDRGTTEAESHVRVAAKPIGRISGLRIENVTRRRLLKGNKLLGLQEFVWKDVT